MSIHILKQADLRNRCCAGAAINAAARWRQIWLLLLPLLMTTATTRPAAADLKLDDICRVKGQEENTLQGLGLIVGLNGTGDPDLATTQSLARILSHMGANMPKDEKGRDLLQPLKDNKNVALVFVTATVPAAGASAGDQLDCTVSAIGKSKSLAGGTLLFSPLLGPRPGSQRVYAFAQGPVYIEDNNFPVTGKVFRGCRLEEDFHNEFVHEGQITLVLNKDHAGFRLAQSVADLINEQLDKRLRGTHQGEKMAVARDGVNIDVTLPVGTYDGHPAEFVGLVLEQTLYKPPADARVVINRKTGTIVIGADVEIGPVAITHKGFAIDTGTSLIAVSPDNTPGPTKLRSLVEALNALNATPQDLIDVLQSLKKTGRLYAQVIIE